MSFGIDFKTKENGVVTAHCDKNYVGHFTSGVCPDNQIWLITPHGAFSESHLKQLYEKSQQIRNQIVGKVEQNRVSVQESAQPTMSDIMLGV